MPKKSPRVVLVGATGYTGIRTLQELSNLDLPVLLLGRNVDRLRSLAAKFSTNADFAHCDVQETGALDGLVSSNDVVVSTVGPFLSLGQAVAQAAIDAGSAYIDSTGEPAFIRSLYDQTQDAIDSGAVLIPAFGYDYLPGVAAAAEVLNANLNARSVKIGYFLTDRRGDFLPVRRLRKATTPATRESLLRSIGTPSFRFRRSAAPFGIVEEPSARRLMHFETQSEKIARAISVGGAEHFALPEEFPMLQAVDVGLGWLGGLTVPAHVGSRALIATGFSGARLDRVVNAIAPTLTLKGYPEGNVRSSILVECHGEGDKLLDHATWSGTEPYQFTARMLAQGARRLLETRPDPGVQGPLRAFGAEWLSASVRQAGIRKVART